jgi:peptidoglycan-associated lipoprotein
MKKANLIGMFLLSAVLASGVAGCVHKPWPITEIPNSGGPPKQTGNAGGDNNVTPGNPVITPTPPVGIPDAIPLGNGPYANTLANGDKDREKFKADTIYFDFDSATIKPSENSKLQELANYFKDNKQGHCLIMEGNCDERGTEKYNLSLGERRALAAREYLANLGVDPQRLMTVTYGASRPEASGHNEEAWKQNRRDDFVLVTPPK